MKKYLVFLLLIAHIFVFSSTSFASFTEENETIEIFEKVSPSVVFIKNAAIQLDWFSMYALEVPQGAGSGFIWDDQGHIVTNFHVIYRADKIEVILSDQNVYNANIVGIAPEHDLAVLKIDAAKQLKPIPVGQSEDLRVGQKTLVIGNPFGLDYSLTTGVVSALGRSIKSLAGRNIHDVIQTDAAINPGNSGGPVLNSRGDLIGVATSIISPSGAYAGVGFAIPVNTVKRIIPQLIQYGRVKRAGLGVVLLPEHIRSRLNIDGVMILEAIENGAADKAGLKSTRRGLFGQVIDGDVILAIDGEKIKENEDLIRILDSKTVGESVELTLKGILGNKNVSVVLEELSR